jgi:hypothetical protein
MSCWASLCCLLGYLAAWCVVGVWLVCCCLVCRVVLVCRFWCVVGCRARDYAGFAQYEFIHTVREGRQVPRPKGLCAGSSILISNIIKNVGAMLFSLSPPIEVPSSTSERSSKKKKVPCIFKKSLIEVGKFN